MLRTLGHDTPPEVMLRVLPDSWVLVFRTVLSRTAIKQPREFLKTERCVCRFMVCQRVARRLMLLAALLSGNFVWLYASLRDRW